MLCLLVAACLSAPDIVFISVDTLRADRLGCYGYEFDTTPNVDRLAEGALLFEDCVTEVPLTSPSFGAMMTSRFPRMNGAARNGLPLPEDIPTLAEELKKAGYQTFCVQSNWTLKAPLCGLARGFDTYEDGFNKKRWGVLKSERYADEVTRIALDLLAKRDPAKPLFCWIHYSDPHAPYRFHSRFNPGDRTLRKLDETGQTRVRYDSEVAYTDSHIGQILAAVTQEAAVVFVADHGESLYEHDYLGHGRRVYQHEVRIPLIIRGPGVSAGRSKIPARGIDIAPTILGLAGLPKVEGMLGADLLKDSLPMDRVRVIETYGGAVPRIPGAKALMASRPPMRQAVLAEHWKLILDGTRPELFDLSPDPAELKDLAKNQPDHAESLTKLIADWDQAVTKLDATEAELSEDDINALESLGYVE
ncbi:MAG: sulfatase [Candidatus Hydrogenedentes bacterium]|nr:sulfatase [Candidatus Hydrogenedentota bacterium]